MDYGTHPTQQSRRRRVRRRTVALLAGATIAVSIGLDASSASTNTNVGERVASWLARGILDSGHTEHTETQTRMHESSAAADVTSSSSSSSSSLEFALAPVDYPAIASVESLPWKKIAEPYKAATFTATSSRDSADASADPSTFAWAVVDDETGEEVFSATGESVTTDDSTFTKAAGDYTVSLTETWSSGEASVSSPVKCKYVRREVRALTASDRDAFLTAFETLAVYSSEEGQELFGSDKYQEKDYFVKKHMERAAIQDCDQWHEGLAFMGLHMAFTLELEQALQAVDPSVTVPFWDFTIEAERGGDFRTDSEVFAPDFFGVAAPASDTREIDDGGRWEGWPIRQEAWNYSSVYNSYGLLRAPWNNNNALTLTRSREMFGHDFDELPFGCSEYSECLEKDNWFDLECCLGSNAHGRIHDLLGGAWDGALGEFVSSDLLKDTPWNTDVTAFLAFANEGSRRLWRWTDYLVCPDYCDLSTPTEDCACACDEEAIAASGQSAYDILKDIGALSKLERFDTEGFVTKSGADYQLTGLTDEEQTEVWEGYLSASCSPGTLGDHYEADSANDITFWPLHPNMERLWHWSRLSSDSEWFDETWYDPGGCEGNGADAVREFKNLVDEDDHFYTNAEIYALLAPDNEDLPYVYDNFEWEHCDAQSIDMSNEGRRDFASPSANFGRAPVAGNGIGNGGK